MNKALLALVAAAMSLSAGSAMAQKKQLVIVVKGLDNPFFEAINQGCQKWNKENASSPYRCFYTGPASTSDEAGEAQIVQDMLGKPDTVAIAISPSNAPLIANAIRAAKPKIPVMTLDADLKKEDAALRKTYLGTDNYLMGFRLGEYLKKAKPNARSKNSSRIVIAMTGVPSIITRLVAYCAQTNNGRRIQVIPGQRIL